MGATLGLNQSGRKPGEDISIVGFDGTEDAKLWTPPLTTLTVDAFGLGGLLAKTLLERIDQPERPIHSVYAPAHLAIRQTTGPIER